MDTPEARAEAEELTRQAIAAPAMARLREVVAFVGSGRPATKAGNLRTADVAALAARLGTGERAPDAARSMDDYPDTAHAFRWAAAAGFLAWRGTKVVAGPRAPELDRDPLSAWFAATITLLEHGLLDGFRQGWRKRYVELLDAGAPSLLAGIFEAGGAVPLVTIEESGWEQVAMSYGFEPDDESERRHVVQLIGAMVDQLTAVGAVFRHDDDVVLTVVGSDLAAVAALSFDEDEDELDLVDTDAQSLPLVWGRAGWGKPGRAPKYSAGRRMDCPVTGSRSRLSTASIARRRHRTREVGRPGSRVHHPPPEVIRVRLRRSDVLPAARRIRLSRST